MALRGSAGLPFSQFYFHGGALRARTAAAGQNGLTAPSPGDALPLSFGLGATFYSVCADFGHSDPYVGKPDKLVLKGRHGHPFGCLTSIPHYWPMRSRALRRLI
jgi:hypothetical protein